jgi:hypothetical protein
MNALSAAMTATGCLLFVYVYERSMRLYGYFQRMLNHPYWMAGALNGVLAGVGEHHGNTSLS